MGEQEMGSPFVDELAAHWAPLTGPFIAHVLDLLRSQRSADLTHDHSSDFFRFTAELRVHRNNVFDRMDPFVLLDERADQVEKQKSNSLSHRASAHHPGARSRNITTTWALKELASLLNLEKPFPRSTFGTWQERGLVDSFAYGLPERTSVARLLLYLSLVNHLFVAASHPTIRGDMPFPADLRYLPARLTPEEKHLSCFCVVFPEAQRRACLMPLEHETVALELEAGEVDLYCSRYGPQPPDADFFLYYSPWPGLAWERRWVGIGSLGAISCGRLLRYPSGRGTLDDAFVRRFLQIWRPSLLAELPEYQDHSYHGTRLREFEMPADALRMALRKLAQDLL